MGDSVLYVAPIGELGGVERFLDAVLPCHDPAHVRPVLVTLADGPWPVAMRERGVRTYVIPDASMHDLVRVTRALLRIIRDERIGLIHSAFSWAHALSAPAATIARVPQIWFHHGPIWSGRWQGWTPLVPARAVFTNSRFNLSRLLRTWHVARERQVQHLCVDPERLLPDPAAGAAFRRRFDIPHDAPTVGIVGFIDDTKGQDLLLEAAQLLPRRGTPPVFVIAGVPRMGAAGARGVAVLERLRAMAKSEALRGRVRFVGHVDIHDGVYDALDVVVQASTQPEAFGMVVLEAMAKARATIATDEGGPPEFVQHEREGLLVPPRDAPALAQAIARLLDDPALRASLGAGGRAAVVSRHQPRAVAMQLESHYARYLRPARGTAARSTPAGTHGAW